MKADGEEWQVPEVALGVAGVLDSIGLQGWCETSRSKGLQMTIAPYSSGRATRPLSRPRVTWDEVGSCASGDSELRLEAPYVLARVEEMGDVFAPVLTLEQELPLLNR